MPTYDYRCTECGHKLEAFQKMSDKTLTTCPVCAKETLRRGPGGGIGLSFTGTGFYKTDYAPSKEAGSCCPCGKNQGSCSTKSE